MMIAEEMAKLIEADRTGEDLAEQAEHHLHQLDKAQNLIDEEIQDEDLAAFTSAFIEAHCNETEAEDPEHIHKAIQTTLRTVMGATSAQEKEVKQTQKQHDADFTEEKMRLQANIERLTRL